ncbi:MAG: hypothetical protein ACLFWF_07390 [Alphaproteobacteria bacterium]
MSVFVRVLCATGLLFAMTAKAWAYGGPGAAITLIGSLVGVGLAIFASLFYVIAWPLRRMLKKRKANGEPADGEAAEPAAAVTAGRTAADSADAAVSETETAAPRTQGH